jgi:hypothetical protein
VDKPLTVSAQRVLQLADTYARGEGCEYTGTDHLLLGMLHQEDSVAATAFERIGVTLAEVASHLHFEPIDLDCTALLSEERPRNFAVRESLNRARVEAERLKDKFVGTEHILLGVLASPQNEAVRMLAGISPLLGGLRDEVLNLLGQREEPKSKPESASAAAPRVVDPHADAFDLIRAERAYQDSKWGTVDEQPHEVGSWLLIAQAHLAEAAHEWVGQATDVPALVSLVKAVAVGVACLDQHGAKLLADIVRRTDPARVRELGIAPNARMKVWEPFLAAIRKRHTEANHAAAQAG